MCALTGQLNNGIKIVFVAQLTVPIVDLFHLLEFRDLLLESIDSSVRQGLQVAVLLPDFSQIFEVLHKFKVSES